VSQFQIVSSGPSQTPPYDDMGQEGSLNLTARQVFGLAPLPNGASDRVVQGADPTRNVRNRIVRIVRFRAYGNFDRNLSLVTFIIRRLEYRCDEEL
jgi:hypothetical protein